MSANVSVLPRKLTKAEVSRRLNVPIGAVDQLVKNGTLKTAPRISNEKAVILEASVDELLSRVTSQAG